MQLEDSLSHPSYPHQPVILAGNSSINRAWQMLTFKDYAADSVWTQDLLFTTQSYVIPKKSVLDKIYYISYLYAVLVLHYRSILHYKRKFGQCLKTMIVPESKHH